MFCVGCKVVICEGDIMFVFDDSFMEVVINVWKELIVIVF